MLKSLKQNTNLYQNEAAKLQQVWKIPSIYLQSHYLTFPHFSQGIHVIHVLILCNNILQKSGKLKDTNDTWIKEREETNCHCKDVENMQIGYVYQKNQRIGGWQIFAFHSWRWVARGKLEKTVVLCNSFDLPSTLLLNYHRLSYAYNYTLCKLFQEGMFAEHLI